MHSKLTFIDGDNKKYVAPLTKALREKYGPLFKETRFEKEESTQDNAVIRLSEDPPAAVAALVQVLQHGAFTVPESTAQKLTFLAGAVFIATRCHLDPMARQALQLFDEHLKKFPSPSGGDDAAFAADFVAAVEAAYGPDPDYTKYYVPELQKLVVAYAAGRYQEMLGNEAYAALFEDKDHIFCYEARNAAAEKMKRDGRGDGDDDEDVYSDGDGDDDEIIDDDDLDDPPMVTIIDRLGKKRVTTRRVVKMHSSFLDLAPRPEPGSDPYWNAVYKVRDHPQGIEAMFVMFEEGVRYWGPPRHREKTASAVIEWFTHALRTGDKYKVFYIPPPMAGAIACEDYLGRCNKPHIIAKAVRVIYACKVWSMHGESPDCTKEGFQDVKNIFVEHFAKIDECLLRKKVYKELFEEVPEFREDVRKERSKKMGSGEDDADKDGDGADEGVEHGDI
ncbi:hypothetical protein DBV05_g8044 [Lasiodiplodia theobromae]|uniref:Uncharacterized protein n=1 Tax=Lasiodiplodia theobromae TaxID=45133 RepID=A0A5N5D7J6_9PEZI|nr:hypothetical protein DBV05_g8044 [Lasiodiplodia theobromae]